jgi:hypothetical protein
MAGTRSNGEGLTKMRPDSKRIVISHAKELTEMVAFGSQCGASMWRWSNPVRAGYPGVFGILPREVAQRPLSRTFDYESLGSLWVNFATLIPEIRDHTESVLRATASGRLEACVAQVVASAFEVYRRLAANGLIELAYPKPLSMAALVWLGLIGSADKR